MGSKMRGLFLVALLGAGLVVGALALTKGAAAINRPTANSVLADVLAGRL